MSLRLVKLGSSHDYSRILTHFDYEIKKDFFILKARTNNHTHSRLGYTVPKRGTRLACRRNRIKRLIREYFRLNASGFRVMDYLVIVRRNESDDNISNALETSFVNIQDLTWTYRTESALPQLFNSFLSRLFLVKKTAADLFLKIILVFLRIYQQSLSKLLGNNCRFYPTCSSYAIRAYQTFGIIGGTSLTIKRLIKCHPFNPGGIDEPPAPKSHSDSKKVSE